VSKRITVMSMMGPPVVLSGLRRMLAGLLLLLLALLLLVSLLRLLRVYADSSLLGT